MSKMPKKKAKKHGVYSSEVLLPGEKQADYEALRQSFFDEWVPDGVTEQYLVDDLCKFRWKKLRLERYDQVCLQQRKDKILQENNANKLIEELRGLAEEFSETESIEEVEAILPWLSASFNMLINKWVPRDKCTEPAKWGQEIGDLSLETQPGQSVERRRSVCRDRRSGFDGNRNCAIGSAG